MFSNLTRVRPYRVRVRVGDYHQDNSNFESGRLFGAVSGGGLAGSSLPIEDDYGVLRRVLWLRTDRTYKQALEALSQKRAYRRNLQAGTPIDDFSSAEALVEMAPKVLEEAPGKSWEQELRQLSALFKNFPRIQRSSVELNVYQGNNYFLNSEGSRNRLPERVVGLRAAAALQAKDGSPLRNEMLILVRSLDELPEAAALEEKVMSTATELIQLAEAPLAEDYSGPVLFTSEASARLLAVLLAPHLSGTRPPERPEGGIRFRGLSRSSAWGSRWKARVLPAFFDVTDDPTKETFNGSRLMGAFPVDREGVRAEPVRLIEDGRLVNFLMSRSPRREISRSERARSGIGLGWRGPGEAGKPLRYRHRGGGFQQAEGSVDRGGESAGKTLCHPCTEGRAGSPCRRPVVRLRYGDRRWRSWRRVFRIARGSGSGVSGLGEGRARRVGARAPVLVDESALAA